MLGNLEKALKSLTEVEAFTQAFRETNKELCNSNIDIRLRYGFIL